MIVFNCGVLLSLENEVNRIHINKATISLTSHNALLSRQLKKLSPNSPATVTATIQTKVQTSQAAATLHRVLRLYCGILQLYCGIF